VVDGGRRGELQVVTAFSKHCVCVCEAATRRLSQGLAIKRRCLVRLDGGRVNGDGLVQSEASRSHAAGEL
jgi:hypothetical protein